MSRDTVVVKFGHLDGISGRKSRVEGQRAGKVLLRRRFSSAFTLDLRRSTFDRPGHRREANSDKTLSLSPLCESL
jgi:hypothetical protein